MNIHSNCKILTISSRESFPVKYPLQRFQWPQKINSTALQNDHIEMSWKSRSTCSQFMRIFLLNNKPTIIFISASTVIHFRCRLFWVNYLIVHQHPEQKDKCRKVQMFMAETLLTAERCAAASVADPAAMWNHEAVQDHQTHFKFTASLMSNSEFA